MTRLPLPPLALLAVLAACSPPRLSPVSPGPVAEPPPAAASLHLRRLKSHGDLLFVTAPPDTYKRGEFLYVLGAQPLYGSTRQRIGLVQVVEPKSVTVTWFCSPNAPMDAALSSEGLPIEDFVPDTTVRVGRCWGRYMPPSPMAHDAGTMVDLKLNLGDGDGMRPDDLLEVLGEPIVDKDNRTVLGFEPAGRCTVLPFKGTPLTSICRIDRAIWPQFDPGAHPDGGYVRLASSSPSKALKAMQCAASLEVRQFSAFAVTRVSPLLMAIHSTPRATRS